MDSVFRRLLSPPHFNNDEKDRQARLLHIILLALFNVLLVFTIIVVVIENSNPQSLLYFISILALTVILFGLTQRGYIRLTTFIVVPFSWAAIFLAGLLFSGANGLGLSAFFISILLAGLLLGLRAAMVTAVFSLIAIVTISVAEYTALISPDAIMDSPILLLYAQIALFSMMTLLLYLALAEYQKASLQAEEKEHALSITINETTTALTAALDLEQVLDTILTLLYKVIPYDSVAIWLTEENSLRIVAGRGFDNLADLIGQEFPYESGLFAEIAKTLQPLVVPDAQLDPRFVHWQGTAHIHGWLGIPLLVNDSLIGFLSFDSFQIGKYGQEDAEIGQSFANQAAIAIENARLFQSEREQRITSQTLQHINSLVTSTLSLDIVLKTIANEVLNLLGVSYCVIRLYQPPDDLIWGASVGIDKEGGFALQEKVGIGYTGRVAQDLKPTAVHDMRSNPNRLDIIGKHNLHSFLGIPMMVKSKLVGVVSVYTQEFRQFNQDEIDTAVSFAEQAAIAVENARLFEHIQQQAATLEDEVSKRTLDLHNTNKQLELEITERKKAEALLQAHTLELEKSNQELQSFAYIVSHDLQAPLRKIQSFGDRLGDRYDDILDERGQDYIKRMQAAAQRMGILMNDLLEYSRITSINDPFTAVDLNAVLKDVRSDLETQIEMENGRLQVDPLPAINGNATQMYQLFQNLISNSLKFHEPQQSPEVHITAEKISGNSQDYLQILVKDNGIGFEEKYLDRIFDIFQRLHGRDTYAGTGVGLATCRKIVQQHGGSITATSQPGQGTTFIITLPID